MEPLKKSNSIRISNLGISPNECDIAVVSIDYAGTPGLLNELVLREYGYSINDLPTQHQLEFGFGAVTDSVKKPILFVVTVNGGDTGENIENNLFKTLEEFRSWIEGKKVWLPLMGTGSGGLSFKESYTATTKVVDRFLKEYPIITTFVISIPDTSEGKDLINQLNNTESFLKNFKGKIYLVGSVWNGDDQLPRFLEEGIWEKGYEDGSYEKIINQVEIGDIIIIKSTYASGGISYLRVKAFGVVTGNLGDGSTFSVDWRVRGSVFDIENKGYYRNTIHQVSTEDAIVILSRVDKSTWDKLFPVSNTSSRKERIAGLISDSDAGADYLNISKDVRAFARVISAKSFEPPLAVALFGKWGSGKSFFMRKLKAQIINLSSNSENGIYCEGVAQIHFNAWSYIDSNLWASLVTKIFEELNEYISENRKDEIEKKEIEKQLVDKLSITKDEIELLENKKSVVVSQIASLEEKKQLIARELDEKIEKLKEGTVWKVINKVDVEFKAKDKILAALENNDSYIRTEGDLKKIVPEKYWSDPDKTYQIAKSKYVFLREFFRKDNIWNNIGVLIFVLLLILLVPGLISIFSVKISKISFAVPQAILSILISGAAVFKRAESVYAKIKPLIASFWAIKESYDKQVKEALSKYEQEEKALNLEIEKSKSEALLIEEQLQKAETVKADLEYRINNAFATEALYSFIDRRSKSEDYKKHLGIVSVIRRDFEILNSLFIGHNQEAEKNKGAEEFKNKFKRPLERIVLYIDDLDRCPEENVVQVLEAVNLLMAFPLFVVIVGVDSRWVKNALTKKHVLQFSTTYSSHDIRDNGLELIEPSSYLEKIFQIPFHLKEAKDANVKDMIMKLAQKTVSTTRGVGADTEKGIIDNVDYLPDSEILIIDKEKSNLSSDSNESVDSKNTKYLADTPEALILTGVEVALMQDMSEVIGNNPRAIKRYVNIYRIIKAHDEFDYEVHDNNQELIAILFLLALPLGKFRKLLPSFESFIQTESNNSKQLTVYLQPLHKVLYFDDLKHELDALLSVKSSFTTLQSTAISVIGKHNDFIRRFTFNNI